MDQPYGKELYTETEDITVLFFRNSNMAKGGGFARRPWQVAGI